MDYGKKKVLITGANGTIGCAIVQEFINKYELILVAPNINKIEKYEKKTKIIKSSLNQISEWESHLENVHCVIHLAAVVQMASNTKEDGHRFFQTNVEGTKLLYEACLKYSVKRFLFFSTNDVYKSTNQLITECSTLEPIGYYSKSKLLAEQYLLENSEMGRTAVCIFRPASVYGDNDKGSMNSLISLCYKGLIPMIGNGGSKKTLLYLKDIVLAVERYIENKEDLNREIFNISSGDYEYKHIIDTISNVYKLKTIKIYIPRWFCTYVARNIRVLRKLTIAAETKVVSSEKAYKLLNYKGMFDLKSGLEDSKNYYKKK